MTTSHTLMQFLRTAFMGLSKAPVRLFILSLFLFTFLISGISQVSAASTCTITRNPRQQDITVCIDSPANTSTVSGVVPVNISVHGPEASDVFAYLNGQYLIKDHTAPFYFELPTRYFADGTYQLSIVAEMRDDSITDPAIVTLHFNNGLAQRPPNPNTFTPHTGTPPAPGEPLIVMATGDGASGERPEVSDMIAAKNPDMFLYLGDVYERGTFTEFYNWYGTRNRYFGKFRDITNPTVGNHEYNSDDQASGYFYYWDNIPHYYSYNAGGWHFISIDSISAFGELEPGDPQYQWLLNDLATNTSDCTLIYMHHPAFSVGNKDITDRIAALWPVLVQHGVDVMLAAHDHNYQRWKPMDANGNVNAAGTTHFVLGAGGHGVTSFERTDSRLAAGADDSPRAYGALYMEMYPDGMVYRYYNYNNAVLDSGSVACGSPPGLPQFQTPPVTGTNTSRPTVHFIAPEKSTYFQVVVSQNGTAVWQNWYPREAACGSADGTQCQLTAPNDLKDGTYDLYLQAWGPGGITQERGTPGGYKGWQGPVSVTIDIPNATLPTNLNVTFDNVDPIFSWNNDPNASWYQLVVKDLTSNTVKLNKWYSKTNSALNCSGATCTIEPGLTLLNHSYAWWIRSWGTGGFSGGGINGYAQGPTVDFSTRPAPTMPETASFQTWGPDFQGTPVPRNYRWNDVQNASWYELVVTNAAKQILYRRWFAHQAVCQSNLCTVGPEAGVHTGLVLNGGEYFWSVRAWGPGGFSPWATATSFTIQ